MEYEPILPPENIKQPEADTELDPKNKKKKKKLGEWITRAKPKEEETPSPEPVDATNALKVESPAQQSESVVAEKGDLSQPAPEQLDENTTEDPVRESDPSGKTPKLAKILKFPGGNLRQRSEENLPAEPKEELMTKGPERFADPPTIAKPESPLAEVVAEEDEPATAANRISSTTARSSGFGIPPIPPAAPISGGPPPVRPPFMPNAVSTAPNVLRIPEITVDERRERVGAFILGLLAGGTIEHIRHRRREKKQARSVAKEQAATKSEVQTLENQLVQEQNKKVMPAPEQKPQQQDPAAPETDDELLLSAQDLGIEENVAPPPMPETQRTFNPELPVVAAPAENAPISPVEQLNATGGVGPEVQRMDLKAAAIKEDAGIVTADIVHPVIERDIERNSIGTFEGNSKIVPPKKLLLRQSMKTGASVIVLFILAAVVLYLLM